MIHWRELTVRDGDTLIPILRSEPDRGCEYTFGNMFMWSGEEKTKAAFTDNGILVRSDALKHFLWPVGARDEKNAIETLLADAAERDEKLRLIALRKEDAQRLEALFPERFEITPDEVYGEYVYNTEDLTALAGKKYHGKRNHIARFTAANPAYTFEEITRENIDRVREMDNEWCHAYGCAASSGLKSEHCAVEAALNNFFELPFKGGCIVTGGRIVAFAAGEEINKDTFCVHIEKAFHDVEGSYAVINRDFAAAFCGDYRYINREDAAGEEGLIKAKESYYPAFVTEKYTALER